MARPGFHNYKQESRDTMDRNSWVTAGNTEWMSAEHREEAELVCCSRAQGTYKDQIQE